MTGRRRYSSSVRDEQARTTRRRVLDAAHALFLSEGYRCTTIEAVAAAAGVSVATVYNAVGGKPALLKNVHDVVLAGDDAPESIVQRARYQAILDAPDARSCLARCVALDRDLAERISPLSAVLRSRDALADPLLADFAEAGRRERASGVERIVTVLAERFGLRAGLSVEDATAVLLTLASWEVAERLVVEAGWGWDRFQEWLTGTLCDALLGPSGEAPQAAASSAR